MEKKAKVFLVLMLFLVPFIHARSLRKDNAFLPTLLWSSPVQFEVGDGKSMLELVLLGLHACIFSRGYK